jgi:hypothetical protein
MPAGSFATDINAIRERARQKMEEGPVTATTTPPPAGSLKTSLPTRKSTLTASATC